jgi:hypothetical protein
MQGEILKSAIIYLDFNRLFYYGSNITDKVLGINIPQTSFRNLEIVSEEEFSNLIKSFLQYHKIAPTQVTLILSSSVYFDTKIPASTDKNFTISDATSYFLDLTPFENIISRSFIWEKETVIVATNQKLCDLLKSSLEVNKFNLESIIPEFVLGPQINLKNGLDIPNASKIMNMSDHLKQYNLLKDQIIPRSQENNENTTEPKKEDNKSLLYLLPVLILMIIIFVLLLSKTQQPQKPKKPTSTAYVHSYPITI